MNFSRLKIEGWLLTVAGVVVLFSSMVAYFHTRTFLRKAPRIDARVVKLVEGYAGTNYTKIMYYPVYIYWDDQGMRREIWSAIGSHPATCKLGDKVTLVYLPDSPRDSKPYKFWSFWSWPLELCGTGIVVLLLGLGLLRAAGSE